MELLTSLLHCGKKYQVLVVHSEVAKDLVAKMLNPDPKKRITAEEILIHPWLIQTPDTRLQISGNLSHYNTKRKIKVL